MKNLPKHNASIIHWEIIQHVFVQMDHLMSVQPLPAFTVTRSRCRWHEISVSANSMGGCNFCTLPYYSSRYLFLTFSGIILKTHPFIINKSAFRYKRTRKN